MKRSNRLLILVGVFLAVIAFIFTVVFASRPAGPNAPAASSKPTPEATTTIVYAKTAIQMGQTIEPSMVETKTITLAERAKQASAFTRVEEVLGLKAGANIAEGAFIYADRDFSPPGTIRLGQDIAPSVASGLRAVAMEVDQVNGVGTLIVPGDHVDVILSVWYSQLSLDGVALGPAGTQIKLKLDAPNQVTTKLVFQNRKVLATLLPPVAPTKETGGNAAPSASATPVPSAATVTNNGQHMIVILEVAPDEAEVMRWAQREEKMDPQNYITLSLALRAEGDNDKITTQGITFRQLVTFYGVMPIDVRGIIPADLLSKITW